MTRDAAPLPGFPEPYGLLCAILQDGSNEWRSELSWGGVDDEAVIWQPYQGSPSIGALVFHMIMAEVYWFERFVLDLPWDPEERKLILVDETDVDEGRWPEPPRQPIQWYFDLHDKVRARTLEAVKRWPEAHAAKEGHGDQITMRWVLGHVIQHESYHGGQAVMLHEMWKRRSAG